MSVLLHHALLALAVFTLGDAALRLAGLVAPRGLERVVIAVVLWAAAAVVETLGLGLLGLGGDPAALTAGAVALWALSVALLPASGAGRELLDTLAGLPPGARAALGAVVGVLVAAAIFSIITPGIGVDGVGYHFPEVLTWIRSGHPGRIVNPIIGLPTGWYPLTNEVILTWGMAISRSFVPAALWTSGQLGLILAAGWLALRRLRVDRWTAALALAAVLAAPDIALEVNTPKNDIAALAWLITCGALVLAAVPDRPRLYAVALVAAALALGSKTTTGPMVVVIVLYGAIRMRAWSWPALGAAAAAALAVGGVWFLRDLFTHGSPLWPEVSAPWGTKVPAYLERIHFSFLQRPFSSLGTHYGVDRLPIYLRDLAGNLVLLGGGALAGPAARTRVVLAASAATVVGAFLWVQAPFTGIADNPFLDVSLFTTRYLLPATTTGALALALATRAGGRLAWAARAVLVGALAWSVVQTSYLQYPIVPDIQTLGIGVGAGALVALAVAGLAAGAPWRRWAVRFGVVLAAASAVVMLARGSTNYVQRNAEHYTVHSAPVVLWFAGQPAWVRGTAPVYVAFDMIGPLAGDRLRHPVGLVTPSENCHDVIFQAEQGWVVAQIVPEIVLRLITPSPALRCLAHVAPIFNSGGYEVFHIGPGPAA